MNKLDELCLKADIDMAHTEGVGQMDEAELRKQWVIVLDKLIRADERKECIAACMEQHNESMLSSGESKKVKEQEMYANTALGAKFAAIRIVNRGSA